MGKKTALERIPRYRKTNENVIISCHLEFSKFVFMKSIQHKRIVSDNHVIGDISN